MVTENKYCQIAVTLSGILLDVQEPQSSYNKYNTVIGKLLLTKDKNAQIVTLTANNESAKLLKQSVNNKILITGFIRNYRADDVRYNVIQVYSIEQLDSDDNINEVNATGEIIGVNTVKEKEHNSIQAVQLHILTSEKYDKHTRVKAVIFSSDKKVLAISDVPQIGLKYNIKGYVQANKFKKENITIDGEELNVRVGEIELVILSISEAGDL